MRGTTTEHPVRGTAASALSSLTTELDIEIPVQLLPPLSGIESGLLLPSATTAPKLSTDSQFQPLPVSCALQASSLHEPNEVSTP